MRFDYKIGKEATFKPDVNISNTKISNRSINTLKNNNSNIELLLNNITDRTRVIESNEKYVNDSGSYNFIERYLESLFFKNDDDISNII